MSTITTRQPRSVRDRALEMFLRDFQDLESQISASQKIALLRRLEKLIQHQDQVRQNKIDDENSRLRGAVRIFLSAFAAP